MAIREALRLDPERPSYYNILGHLYIRQKAWKKALVAAEDGLRLDPEDVNCLNLRALALVELGQREDAQASLDEALSQEPDNAMTHANQGWALLHEGKHKQAMHHFREALRINPMLDWAREGIVEAMKARNPIYRVILRYFLWMGRLTTTEQWGVTAASSGVQRGLRVLARKFLLLYVIVLPLSLLYFVFAFLTWTARPLFALVLRLDPFGRLALPEEEVTASNWVGACLLTSALGVLLAVVSGIGTMVGPFPVLSPAFLILALVGLVMMMPVAGVFRCPKGKRRVVLAVLTGGLALLGLGSFLFALVGAEWGLAVAGILMIPFWTGWIIYSWIANLLIMLRS